MEYLRDGIDERGGRPQPSAALAGVKVVEFAHVIAGPLAGGLMADLGADVVHVEDPVRGDILRHVGPMKNGVGLWWKVAGRNKRSVTLDLRVKAGQDLARRLVAWADVVVTNMRAKTLDAWGLDWASLHESNPTLVMLQISGYGLNTSRRDDPGLGKMAEARSGVAHLTGNRDGPPLFAGFSHGDAVTAVMGAMAIQSALYRRATDPRFAGELIDLALIDSLYRLIEWQVIVYDQLGMVPGRDGNRMDIAPGPIVDTFLTSDGQWLMVTSATLSSVKNVAAIVGEPPADYETVELQTANAAHLTDRLRAWIAVHTADECMAEMSRRDVVGSPIFSAADIVADDTFNERGLIISVHDPDLGQVRMQGVVPRLTEHAGSVWRSAPALGEDNGFVYRQLLNVSDVEYAVLTKTGVI